jgi:YVTN family beta-propeller protein
VGDSPLGITILKKNHLAIIANVNSQDLSIVDLNNKKLSKILKLNTTPLGIAHNQDESEVYVTDWFNSQIIVIETGTMTISKFIKTGPTPSGIAYNAKHELIVITNRDANTIEVYSSKDKSLLKTIAVGNHPFGISTKGDQIFTANVYDDTVSVINALNWDQVTIPVGFHPYNVLSNDDYIFVTNAQDDSVSVIDRQKEIKRIMVGETPENLAINHEQNQLIVTNWGSNSISIIDINSLQVIEEIETGLQSRSFGDFIY